MPDNRSIRPDSSSFDPEIWPVFSCVRFLYRFCSHYELSGDSVRWFFSPGIDASVAVSLQSVLKSFQFHEVNYCQCIERELFESPDGSSSLCISSYIPHLWGKMFDCVRTDRVSSAIAPRRSSRQRSSQRNKKHSVRWLSPMTFNQPFKEDKV